MVEYAIVRQHDVQAHLEAEHAQNQITQSQLEHFTANVSQFLISVDLTLGTGETYLLAGAADNARLLKQTLGDLAAQPLLSELDDEVKTVRDGVTGIAALLDEAGQLTGVNREQQFAELLVQSDDCASKLVAGMGALMQKANTRAQQFEALLFNATDRIFLICENPEPGNVSPIKLTNYSGTIETIRYRKSSSTQWLYLPVVTDNLPVILTASQIENLNIDETIIFQVEISSGVCTPNVFTETAILSVIPSDIKPTPVTAAPDVVCLGEEVTLSSSTGYTNRPNFLDQGAFDNASITSQGWRVRRNGSSTDLGFDTDANNTRFDIWKRATRRQLITADINSPYSIRGDLFISSNGPDDQSGNKGFARITSDNSATLETPVFGIDGLDQAILTFDQMYNLTPGASIKVEISTDGGNSYNTVLYENTTDPTSSTGLSSGNFDGFAISQSENNHVKVDLGNYLGYTNLRIRFSYVGVRDGDVWAVDNIDIPDGPQEVLIEWNDYTNPDEVIFIGNSESETWIPTKI